MHKFSFPRPAFTLIELLLVLVILALVAAVFTPIFAQSRERGRRATCQANIRKLCLAQLQYGQDYDETLNEPATGAAFGRAFTPSEADSDQPIWAGYLNSYLGVDSKSVVLCPSETQQPVNFYSLSQFTGRTFARVNRKQLSIGMISYLAPWHSWACRKYNQDCQQFFRLSEFSSVSQTPIFADSVPRRPSGTGGGYRVDPMSAPNKDYGFSTRHGGVNIGFIDGHVKWYATNRLIASDQTDALGASGQCVNYNRAGIYYDARAPIPNQNPICEGRSIR